ncbi:helix-turn-helix domain-containing protein [Xylocopilactobacillus apis]|uniref:HTH cro/C1-type domain-containing protein n=1 Tax=Xylocopilactobacillus apis TaxID=2932183 RepID=A0AAU9D179_9LACO|nr:helix-turn-helix transcriptional regulator [Xylocopilactobacillus apis]BDR56030.1 hypothetical protein KIMC2_05920 [Xylocopilactobacillus apis]
MEFNKRLQNQRKLLNLTQKEVAENLHVTQQTISSWENGRSYPDLDSLINLSEMYQVSLDVLLKEDAELKDSIEKKQVIHVIRRIHISLLVVNLGLLLIDLIYLFNDKKQDASVLILLAVMLINSFALVYISFFMRSQLFNKPRLKLSRYSWPILICFWILGLILFFSPVSKIFSGFLIGVLIILTFALFLNQKNLEN